MPTRYTLFGSMAYASRRASTVFSRKRASSPAAEFGVAARVRAVPRGARERGGDARHGLVDPRRRELVGDVRGGVAEVAKRALSRVVGRRGRGVHEPALVDDFAKANLGQGLAAREATAAGVGANRREVVRLLVRVRKTEAVEKHEEWRTRVAHRGGVVVRGREHFDALRRGDVERLRARREVRRLRRRNPVAAGDARSHREREKQHTKRDAHDEVTTRRAASARL